MKIYLLLLMVFSSSISFAKAAKWQYLGTHAGRGSPIDGKMMNYIGGLYEDHYDDFDYSFSYSTTTSGAPKINHYTFSYGKTFEKDEGPSLRLFIGGGLSDFVSENRSYSGIHGSLGFEVCPPVKLFQVCAKYGVRHLETEVRTLGSQEFFLVFKKLISK